MRKYAYLARLEELLAALPAQERQEALNYYEEYFDAAGSENEEKTAAELGDPAVVARNILEGEGVEPPAHEPAAAAEASPAAQPAQTVLESAPPQAAPEAPAPDPADAPQEERPEPPAAPPAGPEPPPVDDPDHYPTRGTGPRRRSNPNTRRLWLAFWLFIVLALLIQLSALVFGLGGLGTGGSTASRPAETTVVEGPVPTSPAAESAPAESLPVAESAPADAMQPTGTVAYSSALDTNGKGTLHIQVNNGNVAFRTGDAGHIEVRNMDAGEQVTLENAWGGTNFYCGSSDPNAHIAITLPADAYDCIEVELESRGAVELGDLSAAKVDVYTAEGQIHSGAIMVQELTAHTEQGNIWLEKVSSNTSGGPDSVTLEAPAGSVGVTLRGPQELWERTITTPDGTKTEPEAPGDPQPTRQLYVTAGSTVTVDYET